MIPKFHTGRLAPSPTGSLHLGNARTFLIAWLSSRSQQGRLLLRMEDLDHPKVKRESIEEAYQDLNWLGLDWDEGPDKGGLNAPYVQSQRIHYYQAALTSLIKQELVYPCICSRKDVEHAQGAPHLGDDGHRYAGTCRQRFSSFDEASSHLPAGRIPAWRFKTPGTLQQFHDKFHGYQEQNTSETIGDFVLARHREGAGYQLAVVVDDAAMGVTEVIRGDDLLSTTHRQLLLYRALNLPIPTFTHVPLLVGCDGRRLAKRHGDTRISQARRAGIRPEKVIGYLASTCGWANPDEELTPQQLLPRFSLKSLSSAPTIVTQEALTFLGLLSP